MDWIVIDTETTGLPEQEDARVCEIAAVRFDKAGRMVSAYSSLVRPEVLTEEGIQVITEISGFTEDEIRNAPHPDVVWKDLCAVTHGWAYPLHAWNLEFDQLMVERSWGVPETEAKPWWAGCLMRSFSSMWSVCFGHDVETGEPRHVSLYRAAKIAGVPFEGPAHRALTDAMVAGRVWAKVRSGDLIPPALTKRGTPLVIRRNTTQTVRATEAPDRDMAAKPMRSAEANAHRLVVQRNVADPPTRLPAASPKKSRLVVRYARPSDPVVDQALANALDAVGPAPTKEAT
jgi:DNA polymerase III epsilon subunit-like protein